jgi:DNA-binding LacI/PurR family transcriptional regulator
LEEIGAPSGSPQNPPYDGAATGKTTIRDVAARAEVSVATVSAVLTGRRRVSADLRARVEQAMADLDYRPNLLARALPTRRSQCLALLVPSLANPFFTSLLQAVERRAHENNYSVFVGSTEGDPAKVTFYRERLLAMGVDGVLLALSWDIVHGRVAEALTARGVPVVGVAGARIVSGIDCFVTDDIAAGSTAARYLLGLGHRRIAFIGAHESETTRLRYTGLHTALDEAGAAADPALFVAAGGYTEADAYAAVVELIGRNIPFTAVVGFNDVMALGALNALEDHGLTVPERVSVIGFDDTTSAYSRPKMTTVACPKHIIGDRGVARLLLRVGGQRPDPEVHLLAPCLVARQSTKAPVPHLATL